MATIERTERDLIEADRQVGRIVMEQFHALPAWHRAVITAPTYDERLATQRREEARMARESLERIVVAIRGTPAEH